VFGLDKEAEGAFGSKGYLPHGVPSKDPDDDIAVPQRRHTNGWLKRANTARRPSTALHSALWIAEC
jgi:hypothetical protein